MVESYRGLPELAGLTSLVDACQSEWSVDESVHRLKHIHFLLRRLHRTFIARLTAEPIYELKNAFSYHAYLCAEQITNVRKRVGEMREPPLQLDVVPHPGYERFCDEILNAPDTSALIYGIYAKAIPAVLGQLRELVNEAHPLADAPTIRVGKLALFELQDVHTFGLEAVRCLLSKEQQESLAAWGALLDQCLAAVRDENVDVPAPQFSAVPYEYDPVPQRDERFRDSYNAGVNPEAFLYDERFSPRDKTLMMYYKRIRELDVPEMMASIIHEMPEKSWEFHYEMTRQLWDEARHAMMGEVGFVQLGIDWTQIPINFTWSLNLNTQLTPQERHGVLFFIEQGLMPKTGKRYEWEVGLASGDPLSGLFQDFDWADEVLHSQIGRRWYVPQFASLNDAIDYGDRCWSKVLSHWQKYVDDGLTEHANWWPEIYQQACTQWGVDPDPAALQYSETYEEIRADLKNISTSG